MSRYILLVVCTDKGQHPVTHLGDLTGANGGLLRANVGFVYTERDRRRVSASLWIDDIRRPVYRVQARCPRCRRHLQWRGELTRRVMGGLEAAGEKTLDISMVPADRG